MPPHTASRFHPPGISLQRTCLLTNFERGPARNATAFHRLRLGVTGHRLNKLGSEEAARLRREAVRVIALIRDAIDRAGDARSAEAARVRLQLISPLAEGADRILAEVALAQGAELVALLPFARQDYARDFQDAASRGTFHALLAEAVEVVEPAAGSPRDRAAGYAAVGAAVVARSDMLIAIWDGEEASGAGGTAQVVAHARGTGLPVLWLPTSASDPPRPAALLLEGGIVTDGGAEAFATMAHDLLLRRRGSKLGSA